MSWFHWNWVLLTFLWAVWEGKPSIPQWYWEGGDTGEGTCPHPTPRQCLGQSRESLSSHLAPVTWISSAQGEIFHCCELFTAALLVHLSALSNLQSFHCSSFRVLSWSDLSLVAFCYLSDPDLWCSYLQDMGNSHLMYCTAFTALCMTWCESPQKERNSGQLIYIFTSHWKIPQGLGLSLTTVWASCPSW